MAPTINLLPNCDAMQFTIDTEDHDQRTATLALINEKLGERRRPQSKLVEISYHSLPVVQHALVQRLKEVEAELQLLRIARERDLTRIERWQLPSNLQKLTQEELAEQIDPWITLRDTIADLIKEFEV